MSNMGDIAVEIENLKADLQALHSRMIIERDVADYWYERCMVAEADLVRYAGLLGN